jgi:uncharacterized protein (TIGR03083 family)
MMRAVTPTEPADPPARGPQPSARERPPARDPQLPARLLRAEHDALLPVLRRTPEDVFGRPTACPDWSVRDVLAHCAAALTRAATGRLHSFTPEQNERDVARRREWPLPDLLAELANGYLGAGPAIAAADGRLDVIALGEWVHGGDVRAALGEPGAYASEGFDDACTLLGVWTRRREVPLVEAHLPGGTRWFGTEVPGRAPATLETGPATLIRLFAGRPADPAGYELTGARVDELVVF